jgi:hypothetical protein
LTTPYLYESANIKRGKSDEFVRTVAEKYADLVRHVTVEARGWGIDVSPCRVVPCLEKLENMQSLTLIGDYWMWDVEGEENWDTLEEQLWEYLERISLKQPLASRISTSLRSRKSLIFMGRS